MFFVHNTRPYNYYTTKPYIGNVIGAYAKGTQ